jgi:hypothetical protein
VKLNPDCSPEQISGWLKQVFPDDKSILNEVPPEADDLVIPPGDYSDRGPASHELHGNPNFSPQTRILIPLRGDQDQDMFERLYLHGELLLRGDNCLMKKVKFIIR